MELKERAVTVQPARQAGGCREWAVDERFLNQNLNEGAQPTAFFRSGRFDPIGELCSYCNA
jgi:hypothetical protein